MTVGTRVVVAVVVLGVGAAVLARLLSVPPQPHGSPFRKSAEPLLARSARTKWEGSPEKERVAALQLLRRQPDPETLALLQHVFQTSRSTEEKVWAAAALAAAAIAAEKEARAFLESTLNAGRYDAKTLRNLLDGKE